MSVVDQIYGYLTSQSGVTALVGTRIFQDVADKGTDVPYVVFFLTGEDTQDHQGGAAGLVRTTIRFEVYGVTSDSSNAVQEAIRQELHGLRNVDFDTVNVRSCSVLDTYNRYIPSTKGEGHGLHESIRDYSFWNVQTVPVH